MDGEDAGIWRAILALCEPLVAEDEYGVALVVCNHWWSLKREISSKKGEEIGASGFF